MIDNRAIVDKGAKIGDNADIGPFAIIEDGVEMGRNVKVWPHAYICRGTTIGDDVQIHMGAVVGHEPQDHAYKNKPSFTRIGNGTVIREYATIHRGTAEGSTTTIGEHSYIMAVSHIGHNCNIGNNAIIANCALLAGYVDVGDGSFISGNVVVHQFCRIGKLTMIGGFTGINKDVPPFMLARGPSVIRGLNLVGLRRAKVPRETIKNLEEAYKFIFLESLNTSQAIEAIGKLPPSKELAHLVDFIKGSKRGICKYKYSDAEYFE
jgi:UDP-N-acetylglucosamine acyltransferase